MGCRRVRLNHDAFERLVVGSWLNQSALLAPALTAASAARSFEQPGPRCPRFLDRPSRLHSPRVDPIANPDTSGIVPLSSPVTRHALGCSWQTVLYSRHTGHIESRQVLDDFGGHKHTGSELRGAGRGSPSFIRRCPSLPRMTCKGGMPSSDFPCFAICRASFPGSAPCARLGGRCRFPGSTSMNSGILLRAALAAPSSQQHR